MATLKGFGCNNLTVPLGQFNLGGIHTSWGSWCWNWQSFNIPAGINWLFLLFDQIPPQSELQASLSNPFHGLWWGVGNNEKDLEVYKSNPTPEQANAAAQMEAQFISQQIAAVRTVQPNAKFALMCGSQEHTPDNPFGKPAWIPQVWAHLPQIDKDKIKALRFNWYAQVQYWENGDPRIFNKAPIKREINRYKDWAEEIGRPDLQTWLNEIGLKLNGTTVRADMPEVISYPLVVNAACEETEAERWYWFGYDHQGYATLQSNRQLTALGNVFASI